MSDDLLIRNVRPIGRDAADVLAIDGMIAEFAVGLDIVTHGGAAAIGVEGYGVAPGCRADMVLLPYETLAEAVVTRGPKRTVVKGGRIVARDGACLI